jgi:tetratricopeptide (TPR) repeat protein
MAYANRGFAYFKKRDYSRAIADFDRAIELDSTLAVAYYDRGMAHLQKRDIDYDRGIADLETALRLEPQFPNLRRHLERALLARNRQEEEYISSGITHIQSGNYDKAIAAFDRAIRLNPDDSPVTYLHRGDAYAAKGDNDNAFVDFDQALWQNPFSIDAYVRRGDMYVARGRYDKAVADYAAALRIEPGNGAVKRKLEEARRSLAGLAPQ